MPMNSQWLEENRIVYTQLIGQLSSAEALEMSAAHENFLKTGSAPVHIVVDLTRMEAIPTNLKQNLSMGSYLRDPALGWVVLIGANVVVNFMLSVLSQAFHIRYARRESVDDALNFLRTNDPTLNNESRTGK